MTGCPEQRDPPTPGELTQCTVSTDHGLVQQGWERRHFAAPDRAAEAVEIYRSLGYEVTTRKVNPDDFASECRECASAFCADHVLIYTRKGARNGA